MEKKEENSEKIFYIEKELALKKNELQFLRNIQKQYYVEVLRDAEDNRGRGAIWTIEALWDIDF